MGQLLFGGQVAGVRVRLWRCWWSVVQNRISQLMWEDLLCMVLVHVLDRWGGSSPMECTCICIQIEIGNYCRATEHLGGGVGHTHTWYTVVAYVAVDAYVWILTSHSILHYHPDGEFDLIKWARRKLKSYMLPATHPLRILSPYAFVFTTGWWRWHCFVRSLSVWIQWNS